MAYDRKKLSGNLGAASSSLKVFTYQDLDSTKAQIATADYFLDSHDILEVNDVIVAGGSDGACILAVTASSSTTVTVEEATLA
jgi:hypothetical protein